MAHARKRASAVPVRSIRASAAAMITLAAAVRSLTLALTLGLAALAAAAGAATPRRAAAAAAATAAAAPAVGDGVADEELVLFGQSAAELWGRYVCRVAARSPVVAARRLLEVLLGRTIIGL